MNTFLSKHLARTMLLVGLVLAGIMMHPSLTSFPVIVMLAGWFLLALAVARREGAAAGKHHFWTWSVLGSVGLIVVGFVFLVILLRALGPWSLA